MCHNIYYLNEHLRQSVTAVNRFCWWWNVEERPQELSLVDSEEVEVIARLSVCDPGCGCQILHVTALMLSSGCGTVPGRLAGGGEARGDKAGNQFLCAHRRVETRVLILNTLLLQLALSARSHLFRVPSEVRSVSSVLHTLCVD